MDTFCSPQCLYIKGFTVLLLLSSYFGMPKNVNFLSNWQSSEQEYKEIKNIMEIKNLESLKSNTEYQQELLYGM